MLHYYIKVNYLYSKNYYRYIRSSMSERFVHSKTICFPGLLAYQWLFAGFLLAWFNALMQDGYAC